LETRAVRVADIRPQSGIQPYRCFLDFEAGEHTYKLDANHLKFRNPSAMATFVILVAIIS